jgi:hypothetical protein
MDTTILLSKVLGLGLVICSAAFMVRQNYYMHMISREFVSSGFARMLMGFLELLAGLFLVLLHNDWSSLPAGIISAVGWLCVMEGSAYLFLSNSAVARMLHAFNKPAWYMGGGAFGLVIGAYLALFGFGFIWCCSG